MLSWVLSKLFFVILFIWQKQQREVPRLGWGIYENVVWRYFVLHVYVCDCIYTKWIYFHLY